MKLLLLKIKSEVGKTSSSANALTLDKIISYEEKYDSVITFGQEEDFKLNFHSKTGKRKIAKAKVFLNVFHSVKMRPLSL